MPKTRKEKELELTSLVEGMRAAKAVVFANFQGLTVAKTEQLRKKSREAGVTMVAAKKTLVKRALEEVGLKDISTDTFSGGVATFMGMSDEISPAKVVASFAKENDVVTIFGGVLENKLISGAMVKSLSVLPGRLELLSQVVGTLNAPISGFVNLNASIVRSVMNVLNAYKDKKAA